VSAEQTFSEFIPVARRMAGAFSRKLPRDGALRHDVEAAALGGLWDAARRHEGPLDSRFHSYMLARIQGSMIDELRRQDWLPRRARAQLGEHLQRVFIDDDEGTVAGELSVAPDAELSAIAKERTASLQRAVDALPGMERRIVSSLLAGSSHKAVAVALGRSEVRISQILARAVIRLRGALRE
jgi:RNA polymerase sigma factor (sigma-70 family)